MRARAAAAGSRGGAAAGFRGGGRFAGESDGGDVVGGRWEGSWRQGRGNGGHDGRSLPTISNKLNQEFVRSDHPAFAILRYLGRGLPRGPRRFQEPLDSSARGAGHDCKRLLGRDDPSAHGGCLRAKARTDDPVPRCMRAGFLCAEGEGSHVMGEDGWARQQGEEARRFY